MFTFVCPFLYKLHNLFIHAILCQIVWHFERKCFDLFFFMQIDANYKLCSDFPKKKEKKKKKWRDGGTGVYCSENECLWRSRSHLAWAHHKWTAVSTPASSLTGTSSWLVIGSHFPALNANTDVNHWDTRFFLTERNNLLHLPTLPEGTHNLRNCCKQCFTSLWIFS